MSLKILPFETDKDAIKLRPLMQNYTIPPFPQSVLMVGASSSGKTTLLLRLMTETHFYKGYHDFIFLFSLTAKLDDGFKRLKLKKDHIFDTEESMIESMEIIYNSQKKNVENGTVKTAPKILCIFEDLTTNEKLMRNPIFKSLWTLGRHINIQVIAMIHKYKALPRTARLQAMNIIYFRGSNSEVQQLTDDFTPPNHSKKEFTEIIDCATQVDEESKHHFLYMCNKVPFKSRHRRDFELILELKK
jgi:GTPase SAR1 family protein